MFSFYENITLEFNHQNQTSDCVGDQIIVCLFWNIEFVVWIKMSHPLDLIFVVNKIFRYLSLSQKAISLLFLVSREKFTHASRIDFFFYCKTRMGVSV
jgi:hypothetical protein